MPSSAPERRNVDASAESLDDTPLNPRKLGPSFEIGGERLRVRAALGFFVLAAAPGIAGGALHMAFCCAVVLCAVLTHELGHALCGLVWGRRVSIVLYALGARTSIEPQLTRGRGLIAILAGPATSILLGLGLRWLAARTQTQAWLSTAARVNLAWGGINLLPLLPFAGGRALLRVVQARHRAPALVISGAFSLILAVDGLIVLRNAPIFFVFGIAAGASLFGWVNQRRLQLEQTLELPALLERARGLLASGEPEAARQLATRVGLRAPRNVTANSAWETVAWAELDLGGAERAHTALSRIRPAADVSRYCLAAVHAARGQVRHAIGLLERAPDAAPNVAAVKLLIDLHVQLGSFDRACSVASAALTLLEPDDTRRVLQAAFEQGAFSEATRLAAELSKMTGDPVDAANHAFALAHLGQRLDRLARSSALRKGPGQAAS